MTTEVERYAPVPRRRKSVEVVGDVVAQVQKDARDWKPLVKEMRTLRAQDLTVPEIAEKLNLPTLLVNQVMLQSYKMTVDTLTHFHLWEQKRMEQGQQ